MFNTEQFLNAQFNEAASTEVLLVPEGEYLAVTGNVSAESFREYDIKRGDRAGQKGLSFDLDILIQDDKVKEYLGRPPRVRWNTFIDLTSGGAIDFGKGRNIGLGRLRAALGQNGNGQPWSFGMLAGQPLKVKVRHRVDKDDPSKVYAEVSEVTSV